MNCSSSANSFAENCGTTASTSASVLMPPKIMSAPASGKRSKPKRCAPPTLTHRSPKRSALQSALRLLLLLLLHLLLALLPEQRRFLLHVAQQVLCPFRAAHDAGTEKDHQFHPTGGLVLLLEAPFEEGDVAEDRRLALDVRTLPLDDSAQHEGLAVIGRKVGAEISGVEHGAFEHLHA